MPDPGLLCPICAHPIPPEGIEAIAVVDAIAAFNARRLNKRTIVTALTLFCEHKVIERRPNPHYEAEKETV